METIVIPAIIAKTQTELDGMLDVVTGKVDRVMLDVMDGEFVANVSLDFDFKIRRGFEYEAHLMVESPF
jgi:pentose-5-phosphate-3-epimerase